MTPANPITAWAVRCAAGVSLHLQHSAAVDYAARHHGTVCRLVEWVDLEPLKPNTDPEPPARRMPQGELTPGGLMRI